MDNGSSHRCQSKLATLTGVFAPLKSTLWTVAHQALPSAQPDASAVAKPRPIANTLQIMHRNIAATTDDGVSRSLV